MSPTELEEACAASLSGAKEFGMQEDKACITLVTPKSWKPPPKFPRGTLLQVKENGDRLSAYPAARVLAWVRAA